MNSTIAEGKLSPVVVETIEQRKLSDGDMFTPTEALYGVAALMTALNLGDVPPVHDRIEITDDLTTEEVLFAQIANSSLEPYANTDGHMFVQTREHKNPGACSDAELCFGGVLMARRASAKEFRVGPALVFEDEDMQPVLLQKTYGIDTALGLAPLSIDGVEYPAGTLYSAFSDPGRKMHRRYSELSLWPRGYLAVRRYSTSYIDTIAPLRLSLFALPADERTRYPLGGQTLEPGSQASRVFDVVNAAEVSDFLEAFSRSGQSNQQ